MSGVELAGADVDGAALLSGDGVWVVGAGSVGGIVVAGGSTVDGGVLGTAALVAGGSAVSSSFPPQAASVASAKMIAATRRGERMGFGVKTVLTGGLQQLLTIGGSEHQRAQTNSSPQCGRGDRRNGTSPA
jgi:hypothetical protein